MVSAELLTIGATLFVSLCELMLSGLAMIMSGVVNIECFGGAFALNHMSTSAVDMTTRNSAGSDGDKECVIEMGEVVDLNISGESEISLEEE